MDRKPDLMMVYGDTNSTLAGALAAAKLHIPVAHVEAGLRSFNMRMPEEINRILTDDISNLLFCPTQTAVQNLTNEGFDQKPVHVEWVGDVMQDRAQAFGGFAKLPKQIDGKSGYVLATIHRAENTDDADRLRSIVEAINVVHDECAEVVIPLHPRTRNVLNDQGLTLDATVIDPVGYLEFLALLKNCAVVATDSGGVQKEAFFFQKPGVVLRDQTEWVELIACGTNVLVGSDRDHIISAVKTAFDKDISDDGSLYGDGQASRRIADRILAFKQ